MDSVEEKRIMEVWTNYRLSGFPNVWKSDGLSGLHRNSSILNFIGPLEPTEKPITENELALLTVARHGQLCPLPNDSRDI